MNDWKPPSPLPGPIETARAIVRPYRKGDGPGLYEAVNADRATLDKWLPWPHTDHRDVDDSVYFVEAALRRAAEDGASDFPIAVSSRDETSLLGGVGFHRIDRPASCGEVGYWIRGDQQGEGLCTEVVGPFLTSGFRCASDGGWGFRRITLMCLADNRGSARVAEKLGFRLEQRLRQERPIHGAGGLPPGFYDMLGFALLAEEWDPATHRARTD